MPLLGHDQIQGYKKQSKYKIIIFKVDLEENQLNEPKYQKHIL